MTQSDAALIYTMCEEMDFDSALVHKRSKLLQKHLLDEGYAVAAVQHFVHCCANIQRWTGCKNLLKSAKGTKHYGFICRLNSGIAKKRRMIRYIVNENKRSC